MTDKARFHAWLLLLATTIFFVILSIAYLDRPTAEFFDIHVRHSMLWVWVARCLAPLQLVVVIALLFLLGCGAWVVSGRALSEATRVALLCSWATMWAVAAEFILKRVFGRGWPDPTYVRHHLYGFHLLQGSADWMSFPSGTATVSSAMASVLWITRPRWRWIAAVIVAVLCLAAVINNYHWVADILAGSFLGSTIGWMTVGLRTGSRPIE